MYSCMYLHIYTELRICIIKNFILCLCLLELGTVGGSVKALPQSVLLQLEFGIFAYQSDYVT